MKSEPPRARVAIVGGGFSGTMAAAQLARRGIASVLIEGGGREGRGTAFSTEEPAHLLNVRAEGMSAWADEPEHFSRAFQAEGGDPRGFAERRLFGRYLSRILDEAVAGGLVAVLDDLAMSARPNANGWTVELEGQGAIDAPALLLALGNQPPEPLPFGNSDSPCFINNPWGDAAKVAVAAAAENDSEVLLIGTGLTMVDMVLSLDSAGHQGRIVALSRRGLIPRAHADFDPAPVGREELPEGDVRGLWRWLRKRGGEAGWRAAVDSLRPYSQALWQGLDPRQQRRFLRHARPWWDVHRHRIAPEVSQRLRELVEEGRLEIVAGRISELESSDDGVAVSIRRRGAEAARTHRFAFAFNCTGPLGRISRTADPLLRQMLGEGLAKPDALGIGLAVDEGSRLDGLARAWALGPLTKGRFWEIVAVPDIRVQAAEVADQVARELSHARRA